jgi:hypothetical protein
MFVKLTKGTISVTTGTIFVNLTTETIFVRISHIIDCQYKQ